jgi:serine carboxypeptidase-like clade II
VVCKIFNAKKNSSFIVGEGYAGHFAPQLANLMLQTEKNQINLKGIVIANSLHGFNTYYNSVAGFYWSHGVISEQTFDLLMKVCNYSQIKREQIYGGVRGNCKQVYFQLVHEIGNFRGYTDVLDNISYSWKLDFVIPNCVNHPTFTYLNRRDVHDSLRIGLLWKKSSSSCTFHDDYDLRDYEIPMISKLGTLVKAILKVLAYRVIFFYFPSNS